MNTLRKTTLLSSPTLVTWWGWVLWVHLVGACCVGYYELRPSPQALARGRNEEIDQPKKEDRKKGEEKIELEKKESKDKNENEKWKENENRREREKWEEDKKRREEDEKRREREKQEEDKKRREREKQDKSMSRGTVLLAIVRTRSLPSMTEILSDQLSELLNDPAFKEWFLGDKVFVVELNGESKPWDVLNEAFPPKGVPFPTATHPTEVFGQVLSEVARLRKKAKQRGFATLVLWPHPDRVRPGPINKSKLVGFNDGPFRILPLDTPIDDLKPLEEAFGENNVIRVSQSHLNGLAGLLRYHIRAIAPAHLISDGVPTR